MPWPFNIRDAVKDYAAKVTSRGQLVVAPLEFSVSYQASAAGTIVPENLVAGMTKKLFVIDSLMIAQDRNNTDVAVTLYEADSPDADIADATKVIISLDTVRNFVLAMSQLNIATDETKWINFQHDSLTATISVTIGGYYIDSLS